MRFSGTRPKEKKSLFTLRGLVSCDANKTSSELPLGFVDSGFVKTCNELVIETPIVSQQPSMIIDPAKLDSRYNSDPNLASQQDKKSIINGIPDYNAPPPNSAINPQVSHTPKVNKS